MRNVIFLCKPYVIYIFLNLKKFSDLLAKHKQILGFSKKKNTAFSWCTVYVLVKLLYLLASRDCTNETRLPLLVSSCLRP